MSLTWQDRLEIQDVMTRYAAAIDLDGTEDEFLQLFTEDAVLDSPLTGHNVGVACLKNFWSKSVQLRAEAMVRHHITNVRIDGGGDRAVLKAYFIELLTYREPRLTALPRVTEFLFSGLYDCAFTKSAGTWKMSRRTVFIDAHSPLSPETARMFGV